MFNHLYRKTRFRVQSRIALGSIQVYLTLQFIVEGVGYIIKDQLNWAAAINLSVIFFGMALTCLVWLFLNSAQIKPIEDLSVIGEKIKNGEIPDLSAYENSDNCVGRVGRLLASLGVAIREQKSAEAAQREIAAQVEKNNNELKKCEIHTHAVINELGKVLNNLAKGNLSIRISQDIFEGEFAPVRDAFNASMRRLERALSVITESSNVIANGANEISTASGKLAKRTEHQAASLGEVTVSVKSIASVFADTANNCAHASKKTKDVLSSVKSASSEMDQTSATMDAIKKSSDNVVQITRSVSDIAFKTNVLALNASVEAARAGDAGRGFAVVAKEVQSLAEQSAKAADMIREVLETATTHVDDGVRLVQLTSHLLREVEKGTEALTARIERVSVATENQSRSLSEVSVVVGEMDGMTQQNATMVEEATAAGRKFTTHTEKLKDALKEFTIGKDKTDIHNLPTSTSSSASYRDKTRFVRYDNGNIVQDGKVISTYASDTEDWSQF